MSAPPPPPNLSLFVDVLGLDDTLRLIEAYGGTSLWVPKGVDNSSAKLRTRLEEQFDKKMVRELIAGFGGDEVSVPLCGEWRTRLYRERGMTITQIALKLGCHDSTVSRRLKAASSAERQSSWRF